MTKAYDELLELLRTKCGGCEGICEDAADAITSLCAQLQDMRKALEEIAPAVEALACHQQQCDKDGVVVIVSRQAVDEVVNAINEMAIGPLRSLTGGAKT